MKRMTISLLLPLAFAITLICLENYVCAHPLHVFYYSQWEANELFLIHYEPDGTEVWELLESDLIPDSQYVCPGPLGHHYSRLNVYDIQPRHDPCTDPSPTPYYLFEYREERIETNCIPLYYEDYTDTVPFDVGVNHLGEGYELLRERMHIYGRSTWPDSRFIQIYRGPDARLYLLTPGQSYAPDPVLLEDGNNHFYLAEFDDATSIDYTCSDTPFGTHIEVVLGLNAMVSFENVLQGGFTRLATSSDVIDQQQPNIDTERVWVIGGASEQKWAQVVTAGASGVLSQVRLPVACSFGDLVVEIQEVSGNLPNGVVLTSETIPGTDLPSFFPSPPSFRSLVFSNPITVLAGSRFAIVLSSSGQCELFPGPILDPYPEGFACRTSKDLTGWLVLRKTTLAFQTLVGSGNPGTFRQGVVFLGQYREIATFAEFTGDVTVSLKYNESDIPSGQNESSLRLFHLEEIGWRDVTYSLDTEQNFVSGKVSYLSWFAIGFTTPSYVNEVAIDIKPSSCPNPLNLKSKGVLPVAVLGTDEFDVTTIDPTSIRLEGIAPIRSSVEDVGMPVLDREDVCDCTAESGDGFDDLTLKFDTQAIVGALGDVNDGDELVLTLTGETSDETPIEGKDCVVILKKGKKK